MNLDSWLRRTEWLWKVIGGFFPLVYLYWYIPALRELPGSATEPPEGDVLYARHWTIDFVSTAVAGVALLYLGFRTAFDLTREATDSGEE